MQDKVGGADLRMRRTRKRAPCVDGVHGGKKNLFCSPLSDDLLFILFASSRNRDQIQCACAYRGKVSRNVVKPAWVPSNQQYYPSYNVCPQTNT